MTITLPDEWRERLEAGANRAGFASVEEYVLSLVEEADHDESVTDYPGHPERSPRSRAELEAMLDEGMSSGPAVTADAAFWAERRRVLRERMARRREGGS